MDELPSVQISILIKPNLAPYAKSHTPYVKSYQHVRLTTCDTDPASHLSRPMGWIWRPICSCEYGPALVYNNSQPLAVSINPKAKKQGIAEELEETFISFAAPLRFFAIRAYRAALSAFQCPPPTASLFPMWIPITKIARLGNSIK